MIQQEIHAGILSVAQIMRKLSGSDSRSICTLEPKRISPTFLYIFLFSMRAKQQNNKK
jgi:hypothetical protein